MYLLNMTTCEVQFWSADTSSGDRPTGIIRPVNSYRESETETFPDVLETETRPRRSKTCLMTDSRPSLHAFYERSIIVSDNDCMVALLRHAVMDMIYDWYDMI